MPLVVPGRFPHGLRHSRLLLVSEERDHTEQGQKCRGRALDRHLRALPLGLQAQALTNCLKRGLHLPASHEPRNDLSRIGREVSAQQGLALEIPLRVADQHPADGHGGKPRGVPDGRLGGGVHRASCITVPATHRDRRPSRLRVLDHRRGVREALALQARPSHLAWLAWRGRFVQSGIEPEAGDEGDGVLQMPATIQEFQGGIPTICDGHDLSLWLPASYQQEHLPGPLGKWLVSSAPLLGVALGGSRSAKERQGPHPRGPWNLRQQRYAHPSEGARFDEAGVAGSNRVAVDTLRGHPLPLAALQGLIDAHHQRISFRYAALNQRISSRTRLASRPDYFARLNTRW